MQEVWCGRAFAAAATFDPDDDSGFFSDLDDDEEGDYEEPWWEAAWDWTVSWLAVGAVALVMLVVANIKSLIAIGVFAALVADASFERFLVMFAVSAIIQLLFMNHVVIAAAKRRGIAV